jgi:hypothetical protein
MDQNIPKKNKDHTLLCINLMIISATTNKMHPKTLVRSITTLTKPPFVTITIIQSHNKERHTLLSQFFFT